METSGLSDRSVGLLIGVPSLLLLIPIQRPTTLSEADLRSWDSRAGDDLVRRRSMRIIARRMKAAADRT